MGHVGVFISALSQKAAFNASSFLSSQNFTSSFENDGSSSKHTRLRRKRSSRTSLLFRNRGWRLERYRDWVPILAVDGRRDLSLGALFVKVPFKNSWLKGTQLETFPSFLLPSFLPSFLPLSFLVSFSSSLNRQSRSTKTDDLSSCGGALSLSLSFFADD